MNFELEILERMIQPEVDLFPPDVARYLLDIHLTNGNQERMRVLSRKANRGTLSEEESKELDRFIAVADVIAILHAKARRSLKKRTSAA